MSNGMIERTINTLKSIGESIHREEHQLELALDIIPHPETLLTATSTLRTDTITQLRLAGEGSEKPELHVGNGQTIQVFPLTNPVTAAGLSAIFAKLG